MAGGHDIRASKRYATALFAAAQQAGSLDQVEKDVHNVMDLMRQMPALTDLWHSPLIPASRKRDVITKTLGNSIDKLTLSFLHLLIDKRREDVLPSVELEIRDLADTARHLVRAEATFAVAPTPDEQTALIHSLEQRTGMHVQLATRIDPEILGGVVVRMQDNIIDGSVRGTLERLREQLLLEA